MNLNPRSYRVPVLRLTDVYDGETVNGDPGTNDVIEPTPSPQQIMGQNTGQASIPTSHGQVPAPHPSSGLTEYVPEEPVVPNTQKERDGYIAEPVFDASRLTYTPTTTKPKISPASPPVPIPAQSAQATAPPTPPKPPVAQTATPWTINPSADRQDTLGAVPVVETPPPPPPPPPKPAVAPLKKSDDPFKHAPAPDLPDMWEAAAGKPAPQVAPRKLMTPHAPAPITVPRPAPAPVKAPSSAMQSLIDQTLADMGLGTAAPAASNTPSPSDSQPSQASQSQGPMAGNLANLRARVEQTYSGSTPAQPSTTEPAPAPKPQAPAPHVPETEHAKALAHVAQTLHSIHDSTSLMPEALGTTTTQATPTVRHADFLEEDLIVTPAEKEGPSKPVPMIRTFKADVEHAINHNKVSVVNMIAAEETRRHEPQEDKEVRRTKKRHISVRTYMLVVGSLVLLGITVALGFFIANLILNSERKETTSEIFFSDAGREFDTTGKDRTALMKGLTDLRDTIELDIDEVAEISIVERIKAADGQTEQKLPVTASAFLTNLDTRAPDYLQRTLNDSFIFGVHRDRLGKRHPFFIFKIRTYGIAFQGMLEWEVGLDVDLAPLFGLPVDRALIERAAQEAPRTGSSSAPALDMGQIGLYDDIDVANQAMRALRNLDGEIQLLWTITPGDNLLIITTNPDTFRVIGKRL